METCYVYFGELGLLSMRIMLALEYMILHPAWDGTESYIDGKKVRNCKKEKMITKEKKINIICQSDCGDIFKHFYPEYFNVVKPNNDIYVKLRRCYWGDLNTGNKNNMKILFENCVIAKDSFLGKKSKINNEYLGSGCEKYIENDKTDYSKIKYKLYHINELINHPENKPTYKILTHKCKFAYHKYQPTKKLYIKNLPNIDNYDNIIGIFFRNRKQGTDRNFSFNKELILKIHKNFPENKICLFGNIECSRNINNEYIINPSSMEEMIYYFNRTKILISPLSGLQELSEIWCGIENIIRPDNTNNIIKKLKYIINDNKKIHESNMHNLKQHYRQ